MIGAADPYSHPMRVLLVGDLHGNTAWLTRTVIPTAVRESVDRILALGDFGWWPTPEVALDADGRSVTAPGNEFIEAARQSPIPIWWIDGNHEHHDDLARRRSKAVDDGSGARSLGGNLTHLGRGARLDLAGVQAVVCGGAHSIDRQLRVPGRSWFEAERITDTDIARCIAGGPADILFSHDAPAGWDIPGLIPDDVLPPRLRAELPACWSHRRALGEVFEAVRPELVVHGHYHSGYAVTVAQPWGPVAVRGLDCDGTAANLARLDCNDGAWSVTPITPPP